MNPKLVKEYHSVVNYMVVRSVPLKFIIPFIFTLCVMEYYKLEMYISIVFHTILITRLHFLIYNA